MTMHRRQVRGRAGPDRHRGQVVARRPRIAVRAFISIDRRGEMWLEGANIPEYLNGTWNNHAPKRKRKLLLHRLQITKLARGIEAKGYTIVPLSLYFKDGRVKAEIALARGKKEFDKRQALREEQDKREALRAMRYANMRH